MLINLIMTINLIMLIMTIMGEGEGTGPSVMMNNYRESPSRTACNFYKTGKLEK